MKTGIDRMYKRKKDLKEGKERIIDRGEEKIIILGLKKLIVFLIVPSTKKVLVGSLNLLLYQINQICPEANINEDITEDKQQMVYSLIEETIKPLLFNQ
jgi:hypothetical protein